MTDQEHPLSETVDFYSLPARDKIKKILEDIDPSALEQDADLTARHSWMKKAVDYASRHPDLENKPDVYDRIWDYATKEDFDPRMPLPLVVGEPGAQPLVGIPVGPGIVPKIAASTTGILDTLASTDLGNIVAAALGLGVGAKVARDVLRRRKAGSALPGEVKERFDIREALEKIKASAASASEAVKKQTERYTQKYRSVREVLERLKQARTGPAQTQTAGVPGAAKTPKTGPFDEIEAGPLSKRPPTAEGEEKLVSVVQPPGGPGRDTGRLPYEKLREAIDSVLWPYVKTGGEVLEEDVRKFEALANNFRNFSKWADSVYRQAFNPSPQDVEKAIKSLASKYGLNPRDVDVHKRLTKVARARVAYEQLKDASKWLENYKDLADDKAYAQQYAQVKDMLSGKKLRRLGIEAGLGKVNHPSALSDLLEQIADAVPERITEAAQRGDINFLKSVEGLLPKLSPSKAEELKEPLRLAMKEVESVAKPAAAAKAPTAAKTAAVKVVEELPKTAVEDVQNILFPPRGSAFRTSISNSQAAKRIAEMNRVLDKKTFDDVRDFTRMGLVRKVPENTIGILPDGSVVKYINGSWMRPDGEIVNFSKADLDNVSIAFSPAGFDETINFLNTGKNFTNTEKGIAKRVGELRDKYISDYEELNKAFQTAKPKEVPEEIAKTAAAKSPAVKEVSPAPSSAVEKKAPPAPTKTPSPHAPAAPVAEGAGRKVKTEAAPPAETPVPSKPAKKTGNAAPASAVEVVAPSGEVSLKPAGMMPSIISDYAGWKGMASRLAGAALRKARNLPDVDEESFVKYAVERQTAKRVASQKGAKSYATIVMSEEGPDLFIGFASFENNKEMIRYLLGRQPLAVFFKLNGPLTDGQRQRLKKDFSEEFKDLVERGIIRGREKPNLNVVKVKEDVARRLGMKNPENVYSVHLGGLSDVSDIHQAVPVLRRAVPDAD